MIEVMDEPKTIATVAPVRQPLRHVGPPPAGEQPALLMERATKRFVVGRKKKSVVAVNEVSLSIRRGEIYGILGANGSGKSTLIRLVSTLLTLDGGRVEVFGNDVERDEMKVKQLINRLRSTQRSSRSSPRTRTSPMRRGSTAWTPRRRVRRRSRSWLASASARSG